MTILRPDLLDYEGQRQFVLTIEAHDLVTPLNERRHVSKHLHKRVKLNIISSFCTEYNTAGCERGGC